MTTIYQADTCAPPVKISDSIQKSEFDAWWYASKYCQVGYGQNKQVAADGWNAALSQTIPEEKPNLHDHLSTMLLAKAIPFLEYVEYGTRTSLELRNLIKQAKAVTKGIA